MQKRVVGNINELNEAAMKNRPENIVGGKSVNKYENRGGCKTNKTGFGRFQKFAVIIMLLIVSVFCAIGSADWIISQQEKLPGGSDSTFIYDKKTLQNYIALKGSDETEAAAKVAEAEEYASLQTETDSDDSAVADKFIVKKAAVSKKSAVSTYANGLESAIYGKSAIYNGKPIVAIKKTAGIDNAVADLPSSVLNGSLLTSYKPLTDGSVTEADLTEAYFAEGATSGLPQNAGTYAILVKIKELEAYGYAVKIFTILPCPVTVGWSGVDFANGFTYDGAAHPVTATAKIASSDNGNIEGSEVNANLSVSIAKDGVSVSEVKTAGDYTLTAASGNDNYVIYDTEATRTTSFKVKPAPLAVTVNGKTITYGDTVTFSESDLTFKGFVGGETASVLGGTAIFTHGYEQFSDVGTYTVKASGLTSENYKITYNKGTLTVIKYGLKLSWSDLAFFYDKTARVPTAAITNPLPSDAADPGLNVSVTTGEAINAGSYTAKASVPDDGNYYIASGETKTFTINKRKATVTVTLTKAEILFGSEAPTAEIIYSGVLDGDSLGTPAFDYGGYKKGSDVGTYTVTVKGLANGNYDIKTTSANFTVTPYGLNIEWSDTPFTYNKTAQKPIATIKNPITGLAAPVVTVTTYSETGVAADAINAGSYTAKASVTDGNYSIASGETANFTINKKSVTIIVGKSVTYGDTATFSENDLTITGLIGNDTLGGNPTFASEYTAGSPVAEEGYAITVTFSETALNPNYSLDSLVITGTLTVNKKALTIKVKDCSVNYGGDPDFELEYTAFVNGETSAVLSGKPVFDCDYEKGTSPAGKTYIVKVSGFTSENYKINYLPGTLTVSKKSVTITIEDKTIIYGDEAPTSYGYTIKDTLTDEDISTDEFTAIKSEIDFACSYEKGYPAGDYKITATCNNDNYTLTVPSGKLTVSPKTVTVTTKEKSITYGDETPTFTSDDLICDGLISGDTLGTPAFDYGGYVKGSSAGKYTVTVSGLANGNYNIVYTTDTTGKLVVNKYGLRLTWSNTTLTYNGTAQAPTPTISNPLAGFAMPTVGVTKDSYQTNIGKDYVAVAEITGENSENYTLNAATAKRKFDIVLQTIILNNIIELNYNADGITFDDSLFDNAFTDVNGNAIKLNEGDITFDMTNAVAKNFSGTETASETAGLFSYTFGKQIKAGSTYIITGVKFTSDNYNIKSSSDIIYLKYKTAMIGETYYTIEDAINFPESGDIVLASNSTDTKTYVITSFSKIGYYGGNSFTCGKNIIVPYADGKTTSETKVTTPTTGNVGSVLIVPDGISLTINSATLDILAVVAHDSTSRVCTTATRGVVMNHGTIKVTGTINNGDTPNIKAYGYLKGTGNVIVTDGATAEDLFHIFDFKGGRNTLGITKSTSNYLPLNSYSIHNISCNIQVFAGSLYTAFYQISVKVTDLQWFSDSIPVVGKSNSSSALFKLSEGYIEKRAIPADNSTSKDLDTITGSNQIKGQKEDIRIHGTAVDGAVKITVSMFGQTANMQTGTNNPLPIPYMNIKVCKGGNLTLENSSYKFMPGSALIVDDSGSLTVGSNAKLVFYSVDECTEYEKPVTYKTKDGTVTTYPYIYMTNYCVDKVDAYFEVNSNNTSLEGYLSGKITTKNQNVKINIKNASATITVLNEFQAEGGTLGLSAKVSTRSVSMTATGNIMADGNNYGESEFTAGEYTSYQIGNEYYWASSSILKTVTLLSDGKQYGDTITEIIGTTITLPTELQKKHYTFGGWSDGSTIYNGSLIVPSFDLTLNAVWTPINYTINYEFWYNDQRLSDELTADIVNANPATFTCDKNITFERVSLKGYTFDKWYIDSEFGTSVSQTSDALKYIEDGSVTLYGRFIEPAYTITYYVNNDEISAESLKSFVENLQFEYSSANTYISYLENGTAFSPAKIDINDGDTTKSKYFLGWYTDENCETPFGSLSDTTKVNLYAKWGLKAQIVVVGIDNAEISLGYGITGSEFSFSTSTLTDTANTYKLIGTSGTPILSNATATVTTNDSNLNDISVSVNVDTLATVAAGSSNTAPQIKVTADIRKILTVTITMSRKATYRTGEGYFEINEALININQLYSLDSNNWNKSTGTNIINTSINKGASITLYTLENNSTISIKINDINVTAWVTSKTFKIDSPQRADGCTYTPSHNGSTSTFVFTITNNATIEWSGKQT